MLIVWKYISRDAFHHITRWFSCFNWPISVRLLIRCCDFDIQIPPSLDTHILGQSFDVICLCSSYKIRRNLACIRRKGSFDRHFRVTIKFLGKKKKKKISMNRLMGYAADLKRWNDKDRRIVNIRMCRDERAWHKHFDSFNVRFETFEFSCFFPFIFRKVFIRNDLHF